MLLSSEFPGKQGSVGLCDPFVCMAEHAQSVAPAGAAFNRGASAIFGKLRSGSECKPERARIDVRVVDASTLAVVAVQKRSCEIHNPSP